jgi:hypothetical protein
MTTLKMKSFRSLSSFADQLSGDVDEPETTTNFGPNGFATIVDTLLHLGVDSLPRCDGFVDGENVGV